MLEEKKQRKELVECPECSFIQFAIVENTPVFDSYVHECKQCGYIITESDWQLASENTKFLKAVLEVTREQDLEVTRRPNKAGVVKNDEKNYCLFN